MGVQGRPEAKRAGSLLGRARPLLLAGVVTPRQLQGRRGPLLAPWGVEPCPGGEGKRRGLAERLLPGLKGVALVYARCFNAAWAAAKRAMGTRKGEQLT